MVYLNEHLCIMVEHNLYFYPSFLGYLVFKTHLQRKANETYCRKAKNYFETPIRDTFHSLFFLHSAVIISFHG